MKIHDCEQGTPEWLALRMGVPTASELGDLLTDKGAVRGWGTDMPISYLASKLSEKWLGIPEHSFSGGAMENGSILEEEAVPWYELEHRVTLGRPGFITTDDGLFGCSPDAIVTGEECGLEIKCPQPNTHVKWLIAGGCPKEHLLQCQGGMFATGWNEWMFVSYCRSFPPLVVTVERDDEIQEAIFKATTDFADRFKAEWARLVERNGGKEPKRKAVVPVVRDADPFAVGEVAEPNKSEWR